MDQSVIINTSTIFDYVRPDLLKMEDLIRQQMKESYVDLTNALELLLSSGGKRVRPTITILVGKCLKADYHRIITMAGSIELLHTATLVHDDLIDGSLLRRGSPTLNSKWSAGATVLTGDYLFATAARLSSETASIEALKLFSQTLQTIVNGEVRQMFSPRCLPGREEYYKRIYAKTASLFETSAAVAGIISEAGKETVQALSTFGREIGMAFQIADDILDFTGDESVMGKPKGSDLRQGLITLPTQIFIEDNPHHPVVEKITTSGCISESEDIKGFIQEIIDRNTIEKSYSIADEFIERGINALEILPNTIEKQMLISLVQSQARRNF
ncbi:polyprenyl synthetase family protein [Leptolinea tardivitalis]|uniref:polyprenyl synthetase family protein n=1 Tax=Leptolinea tardivitalis TaxID=229920 RepID=UPI0007803FE4|nr:polyprenyl synthetase family protein [Leptolinea tardivitalis]GAP22765.1 geranylgeranyl pyrophosphate synthase [Leptolinea tardivitalis]